MVWECGWFWGIAIVSCLQEQGERLQPVRQFWKVILGTEHDKAALRDGVRASLERSRLGERRVGYGERRKILHFTFISRRYMYSLFPWWLCLSGSPPTFPTLEVAPGPFCEHRQVIDRLSLMIKRYIIL